MGCVMSRKVSTTASTDSQASYSPRDGVRCSTFSSSSGASAHYRMESPTFPTVTNYSQGSTPLVRPERVHSPAESPPQIYTRRPERTEEQPTSARSGINSLFRSKKAFDSMTEIPLTENCDTSTKPAKKQKPAKSKKSKKNTSSGAQTESKLEISWPTSCHRNPGLPSAAIALGYPYPYPFPLSTVPSDPDLVATAEEAQKQNDSVYCGYYGYEYECLVEAGKEGPRGGVRLEIRPGRNPKWEEKDAVVETREISVEEN